MSDSPTRYEHGSTASYSTSEPSEVGGGGDDRTPRQSPRQRDALLARTHNEQSPITPPRPSLGPRSWTSVDSSPQLKRSRFSFGRRSSPEREWSVFGQRMENEGQLRSPESLRLKRRSSPQSIQNLASTTSSTLQQSRPDSILEEGSALQSPIQDSFSPIDRPENESTQSEYESDNTHDNIQSSASSLPLNENMPQKPSRLLWKIPEIPALYKNIMKCSLAYLIGSLFTFVPVLAHFIGGISSEGEKRPSPSGHMVTTVYVRIFLCFRN